jgi:hypothetical protein
VDGVQFPAGTEFQAPFKGKTYTGVVADGRLSLNGKSYGTPSAAAYSITGYAVNGWRFWKCRRPGDAAWMTIDSLRV